jgi:hypothetical protein
MLAAMLTIQAVEQAAAARTRLRVGRESTPRHPGGQTVEELVTWRGQARVR